MPGRSGLQWRNRDPSTGARVCESDASAAAVIHPDANDPGDSGGEATPVPIPNTEVKLSSAEDTERAAFRENRSSPGLLHLRRSISGATQGREPSRRRHAGVSAHRGALRPRLRRTSPSAVALSCRGMTVTGDPVRLGDDQHPDAPATASPRPMPGPVPNPVTDVCPYLIAGDGSWQSAHAIREHRCGAIEPAVPAHAREAAPAVPRGRTPDLCHVPRGPGARNHDWERARAGARRRADPVARDPLDAPRPRT